MSESVDITMMNAELHYLARRNADLEAQLAAAKSVVVAAKHVSDNRELGTKVTKRDSWADHDHLTAVLKTYQSTYGIPRE